MLEELQTVEAKDKRFLRELTVGVALEMLARAKTRTVRSELTDFIVSKKRW